MEFVNCYAMASWMIEDAIEKYGFTWRVSDEAREKLKEICGLINGLMTKFEAYENTVSVDETGLLHIRFLCPEIVIDDAESGVFFTVVRNAASVFIKKDAPDGEAISVEFCFAINGD